MAPHLMRAQGAYKADKHARPTHAHTPTNTPPTHTHTHTPQKHRHTSHGFDGNRRKKMIVGRRKEVGFQFWLERGEWGGMPSRERKRVWDARSNILKGSLPKSPPATNSIGLRRKRPKFPINTFPNRTVRYMEQDTNINNNSHATRTDISSLVWQRCLGSGLTYPTGQLSSTNSTGLSVTLHKVHETVSSSNSTPPLTFDCTLYLAWNLVSFRVVSWLILNWGRSIHRWLPSNTSLSHSTWKISGAIYPHKVFSFHQLVH